MDDEYFNTYLNDRYRCEVKWYDDKAKRYKKLYLVSQWIIIFLSAITPILIALDFAFSEETWIKWIPLSTSFIVAVVSSAQKSFKVQENWLNYRTICETLRKEQHLLSAKVDEYGEVERPQSLFVERVESLISRENTLWFSTYKKSTDKDTDLPILPK